MKAWRCWQPAAPDGKAARVPLLPSPCPTDISEAHRADEEDDGRLSFDEVIDEERQGIDEKRTGRRCYMEDSEVGSNVPFSVAFSGGGVRAAAFQAGVLWHLAESGHLKDVEYLVGVSGGSYIATAFASHVLEARVPQKGETVDSWYLRIVAKTLCRMQGNWPYLARDLGKNPFAIPKDGSSFLPRIFDIPILVTLFVSTLLVKPMVLLFMILAPLTEIIEFFFGAMMRIVFCSAAWHLPLEPKSHMLISTHISTYLQTLFTGVVLTFLIYWVTGKTDKKARRSSLWFFLKGLRSVLKRAVVAMSLLLWLVDGVTVSQIWAYKLSPGEYKRPLCREEPLMAQLACAALPVAPDLPHRWLNSTTSGSDYQSSDSLGPSWWPSDMALYLEPFKALVAFPVHSELELVFYGVLFMLVVSLLVMPLFPNAFNNLMTMVLPLVILNAITGLVRWRVFGPYSGQNLNIGSLSFDHHNWHHFVLFALLVTMLLLPKYSTLTSPLHQYYRRSLRKAFFAKGEDNVWNQLETNPFCPFILVTGTVSDYKRPGDSGHVSMITFSSKHTGSQKTKYVRTPSGRSVSKIVALSGAASDASILGRNDQLRFRFWLEVLNLYMGEFVIFRSKWSPRVSVKDANFYYRLPTLVIFEFVYGLMFVGTWYDNYRDQAECHWARRCYKVAVAIAGVCVFLSFFIGCLPSTDFLMHSPVIRGVHRITRFFHVSTRPPSLLYVTDGGILDSTGLVELARRRCRRILLVYAGNDRQDTLKSLKKAMASVVDEKIGSFYDPEDPRRDISEVFSRFRANRNLPYLHLGILYQPTPGVSRGGSRETGHIFLVKNRLPPEMMEERVRPLLTEEEIMRGMRGSSTDVAQGRLGRMRQCELGGCCCDCCHVFGCNFLPPFGRRFPSPPTYNQLLTPQLFNSLCRLGRCVSKDALAAVTTEGALERPWEAHVTASSSPPTLCVMPEEGMSRSLDYCTPMPSMATSFLGPGGQLAASEDGETPSSRLLQV